MRRRNGVATLGQLYIDVPRIEGVKWGTKTVNASIRRIVQVNSRDFFKVRPGLWALTSEQKRIKAEVIGRSEADEIEFTHGYYQGLLVELGNIRKHETYVPAQDKNRKYLQTPLRELITLDAIPDFTYHPIVQQARTIDVSWFNERKLPTAFYEVERSTDFHRSLVKFVELQDFNASFTIVADQHREREFNDKLRLSAFSSIRERVQFSSFERVAEYHTKAMAFHSLGAL